MGMKDLLTNIQAFLRADIDAGEITIGDIESDHVVIGYHEDPSQLQMTKFPYITLDDGGERTEEAGSGDTMWRIYSVVIEFAVFKTNVQDALADALDLNDQVKASLEKEENRQLDDFIWGVSVSPFEWEEDRYFYRARNVTVEYRKMEFTYELRH